MNKNLEKYLTQAYEKIIGFQEPSTFMFLDYLDKFVEKKGGALEIGVHHGQFFIGLNSLIPAEYKSYAIDIFDQQELNIDNSGEGNLSVFLENLDNYDIHKGTNTVIIKGDSTDLSIFESVERCHYISVDGGHTPEHVINDLNAASNLITDTGVVILDDYFNHWWPSVTEGITKYLLTYPKLVPFASTKNKLWLCRISIQKQYYEYSKNAANFQKTPTRFFGHDIIDLWN